VVKLFMLTMESKLLILGSIVSLTSMVALGEIKIYIGLYIIYIYIRPIFYYRNPITRVNS